VDRGLGCSRLVAKEVTNLARRSPTRQSAYHQRLVPPLVVDRAAHTHSYDAPGPNGKVVVGRSEAERTNRVASRPSGWDASGGYDALVLDAANRQSLATVRSLGRAGLRVALAECFAECDPTLPVMAFHSRYSAHNLVLPSFSEDPTAFAAAVLEFVDKHPTPVVLPSSDGAIAALLPWREKLADRGSLLALPSDAALEIANDKGRTLDLALRLGIDQPRTMRLECVDDVAVMLSRFELPVVLKPTSSWAPQAVRRLKAAEVVDESEAVEITRTILDAGAHVLAQQWIGGRREGVTLFVANGEILASLAHVEHRTSPALGGASVLRETMAMPEDVYNVSVRLVDAVGLEGYAEIEFRRDSDGRPLLMEINARLTGSIETAQHAGIDFPLMVWRWTTGLELDRSDGYEAGIRMRWLRGDMRWLRDNYRRVGRPDSVTRPRALWMFASEFVRATHYDCLDRGDLRPVVAELQNTAAALRKSSRIHEARTDSSKLRETRLPNGKGAAYAG
jgi:predicted ATP-grasp superfamily ATP-dependent carboligase